MRFVRRYRQFSVAANLGHMQLYALPVDRALQDFSLPILFEMLFREI